MRILLNTLRNSFLLLFVVYFAQGALYAQGSPISQSALVMVLAISLYCLFRISLIKSNQGVFLIAWIALLVLNVVGFIFTGSFSSTNHMNMFKGILLNSLPFYPAYYLARKEVLRNKHLIVFLIVMLPVVVLRFQFNELQVILEEAKGETTIVNNVAYSFVGLMPFVFLIKGRRLLSAGIMLFLMYFIIIGAKRGAMVAGAVCLLFYMYYQLRTVEGDSKWKGYVFALIGIIALGYFGYELYQNNEYLVARMQSIGEEGGSSGRDRIYSNIFNAWHESGNPINRLFGFGFAASLTQSGSGHFAHNDWLELLSNFGLLGLFIYLVLFFSLTKRVLSSVWEKDKRILILTILALWFIVSMVSMSYTNTTGGFQAIILGFLLGNRKRSL